MKIFFFALLYLQYVSILVLAWLTRRREDIVARVVSVSHREKRRKKEAPILHTLKMQSGQEVDEDETSYLFSLSFGTDVFFLF